MASQRTVTEQDPIEVAPHVYRVALENDRVRVLEVSLGPGERVPQHSHPSMVIYALNDGRARFTLPDGRTEDIELRAGQAVWLEPTTHSPENTGDTELRVLNIEFKG